MGAFVSTVLNNVLYVLSQMSSEQVGTGSTIFKMADYVAYDNGRDILHLCKRIYFTVWSEMVFKVILDQILSKTTVSAKTLVPNI